MRKRFHQMFRLLPAKLILIRGKHFMRRIGASEHTGPGKPVQLSKRSRSCTVRVPSFKKNVLTNLEEK